MLLKMSSAASPFLTSKVRKASTLVVLMRGGRALLGMKKRGFGEGKWNGFGGKLEHGESIAQCAARELEEESGLSVSVESLRPRGPGPGRQGRPSVPSATGIPCASMARQAWPGSPASG